MSGREAVPRTRFARVGCGDPGVTVFRISGSLGPRAKPQLVRLVQECMRRSIPRLVLDLSEVDALGGGTARLLNEFAAERAGRGWKTAFRVTSRTVRGFLCADPHLPSPRLVASLDEAVAAVRPDAPRSLEAPLPPSRTPARAAPAPPAPAETTRPLVLEADAGDGEPTLDLDLDAIVDEPAAPWSGGQRIASPMRDRLVAALHDRGVASRVFVFQLQTDRRYYLMTRQGLDRERAFAAEGGLATSLRRLQGPGFLVDLDPAALSDAETELVGELNCEVAAPLRTADRVEHLVFLSKEQPGDEYGLEELQQIEDVLGTFAEGPGRPSTPASRPQPRWPLDEADQPPTRAWSLGAHRDGPEDDQTILFDEPERQGPIRVDLPAALGAQRGSADTTRALRRNLAQMRDILSLSQDFDAAFGTSKLLEVLVLSVVSVARVEAVLYFSTRDGEFRLTHHRGMAPDAIQGLRLRGDSTLAQRAVASQQGVCIGDDAQITEEERIWARQHGLRWAVPFRFKEETLGLLLLGESAEDASPDLETLGWLLAQAGLAFDRARLYETLQDRTLGVVRGLITLIEARNGFDCGSTEQVVRYTQALARELQYPGDHRRDLVYGAVLRDVGMLKVSEALLRSAADLTGDQWESIRRHPQEGASIMRQMRFSAVAVDVVLHHHEAYSGEGYPMGLRGRAIPLGARIVAVAESYVKMTMDRPYRKALGKAEALESLAENWGLRYDPLVVDALVRVVNRELSWGLEGDHDLAHDLFGV